MPVTITGNNTPTAGGVTYGDGATYANTAAGTAGQVLTSNGASAPTWGAAPSPTAANQTEMEAATSNTVFATPLNTNWHPGVAKMWIKCNGAKTTINASHNVTSITDDGAGLLTVTIATDFSSANYAVLVSSLSGNYSDTTCVTAASAGAVSVVNVRSGSFVNPSSYFVVCFGDQS